MMSKPYPVQRGIKQGSVLSPALFLLVMDPLLKMLEQSGLGLSAAMDNRAYICVLYYHDGS